MSYTFKAGRSHVTAYAAQPAYVRRGALREWVTVHPTRATHTIDPRSGKVTPYRHG